MPRLHWSPLSLSVPFTGRCGACVQWYEKWWEVSDWKGMKEMGAEKWGCNARGEGGSLGTTACLHTFCFFLFRCMYCTL
jgi:hypothetical protein